MASSPKREDRNDPDTREKWSMKMDYILSMVGYSVGFGNLWRFPYVCMKNGGGAFLIPYIMCLVFCGLPIFFMESATGQFLGKGTTHIWEMAPLFKGLGISMVIIIFIYRAFYNSILAWVIYYIGNSFINPLPWSTCNNSWNTPNCVADFSNLWSESDLNSSSVETSIHNDTQMAVNASAGIYQSLVNNSILENKDNWLTSPEEFWRYNVLQMSGGIDELGSMNTNIVICLLISWIIICVCIVKGIKISGKVIYVTALLPYLLITVLLIRIMSLEGASDGLVYYLIPDFKKIFSFKVWLTAAIQVFYSLGLCSGTVHALASFNKFENNCLRDAILLPFLCEATSVYAGFLNFGVLGFLSHKFSVPISKIVKSGPGLGFVAYPEALSHMPGQQVWSILFFITLLTIGMDSVMCGCETVIVAITDSWPSLRPKRPIVTIVFCIIWFLVGIIFCTQGGIYLFQLVDWYAAFSAPLLAVIECIVIGWIYGTQRFSKDIKMMIGRDIPLFFRICTAIVVPAILTILFVFGIVTYKPPRRGNYRYPEIAVFFGFIIGLSPLVPLPVCAFMTLRSSPGLTLKEKLAHSIQPTEDWKPNKKDLEKSSIDLIDTRFTKFEKIKLNITGKL